MIRMLTAATIVAASVSAISPARAAFHLWEVNEIYSNADGSVQFVELITPDQPFANNEHFVAGHRLITSTANPDNVFTFPTNLSTSIGTRSRTILIATPGFAQLPGAVTPDYTLPAVNFFSTVADTVRFDGNSGTTGRIIFAAGQLPTDGVMSINRNLTPGVNSPKNFLNQVGSLTTPLTPGDVNGDGAVDRADAAQMAANLGRTAATREQGDLNGNGTVGLLDAAQLQLNLDLPLLAATSAVPEPGPIALALATLAAAGLIGLSRRSVSRRLQSRA